jgi:hypothetical protein
VYSDVSAVRTAPSLRVTESVTGEAEVVESYEVRCFYGNVKINKGEYSGFRPSQWERVPRAALQISSITRTSLQHPPEPDSATLKPDTVRYSDAAKRMSTRSRIRPKNTIN